MDPVAVFLGLGPYIVSTGVSPTCPAHSLCKPHATCSTNEASTTTLRQGVATHSQPCGKEPANACVGLYKTQAITLVIASIILGMYRRQIMGSVETGRNTRGKNTLHTHCVESNKPNHAAKPVQASSSRHLQQYLLQQHHSVGMMPRQWSQTFCFPGH
jgi:hypothetical protein